MEKSFTIKLGFVGNEKTGKKTLINSIKEAFKDDTRSSISKGIYNIKNKKYFIDFETQNKPERSSNLLKTVNIVFVCFNSADNESFEDLSNWINEELPKSKVMEYILLINNYKEPCCSLVELESRCNELNKFMKSKFSSMHIFDFTDTSYIRKVFEDEMSNYEKNKVTYVEEKKGSSCYIY